MFCFLRAANHEKDGKELVVIFHTCSKRQDNTTTRISELELIYWYLGKVLSITFKTAQAFLRRAD